MGQQLMGRAIRITASSLSTSPVHRSTPRRMGRSSSRAPIQRRSIVHGKIIMATWSSSNTGTDFSHYTRIFQRSLFKQVRKLWRGIRSAKLAERVWQLEVTFFLKYVAVMLKTILRRKTPSYGWLKKKMKMVNY